MQCLQPLIFTQAVQKFRQRLRIRNRIFQFDHTFGHVGVDIGHTTQSNVFDPLVQGPRYLGDDIVRSPPQGDAFLGLDTESTSSFVSHTSLVDFNLVSQRAQKIRMLSHRLGNRTGLRPSSPLNIRSSLMAHFSR